MVVNKTDTERDAETSGPAIDAMAGIAAVDSSHAVADDSTRPVAPNVQSSEMLQASSSSDHAVQHSSGGSNTPGHIDQKSYDDGKAAEVSGDEASGNSQSGQSQSQAQTQNPPPNGTSPDPELQRLKAIHAARQSARRRPPVGSMSRPEGAMAHANAAPMSQAKLSIQSDVLLSPEAEDVIRQLKATHEVELQSLRRNHIENLRKVAEERDMFAAQLVKEQSGSSSSNFDKKQLNDLNAQLRAARIRTTDLQEELARLQEENKQLSFRVQANKTLYAAADSYAQVVEDLVNVKIKCAQLEEEKEEYRRASKEASSSIALLAEANGDLERSRAEWVIQCADLQRTNDELKNEIAELTLQASSEKTKSKAGDFKSKTVRSPASPNSSLSGVSLD